MSTLRCLMLARLWKFYSRKKHDFQWVFFFQFVSTKFFIRTLFKLSNLFNNSEKPLIVVRCVFGDHNFKPPYPYKQLKSFLTHDEEEYEPLQWGRGRSPLLLSLAAILGPRLAGRCQHQQEEKGPERRAVIHKLHERTTYELA